MSRGASFALFVDEGIEARALLRGNVEAFGLGGVTRIWRADATKLGKAPAGSPFTLAFLDPPYGKGLAGPALAALGAGGWLPGGALCVVEEAEKAEVAAPEAFGVEDERVYGDTKVMFLGAWSWKRRAVVRESVGYLAEYVGHRIGLSSSSGCAAPALRFGRFAMTSPSRCSLCDRGLC